MAVDVQDGVQNGVQESLQDTNVPGEITTEVQSVLPVVDFTDPESVKAFQVAMYKAVDAGVHGIKGIPTLFKDIERFYGMADARVHILHNKINRINGQRTEQQARGDVKKSQRNVATKFYSALDQASLYAHAKMAKLNPALYDDDASLITAMVDAFMAAKEGAETFV